MRPDRWLSVNLSARKFRLIVGGTVLLYALGETAYVRHLPLLMDEFDGAGGRRGFPVWSAVSGFAPYKTVLGTTSVSPISCSAADLGKIDGRQGRDDACERCRFWESPRWSWRGRTPVSGLRRPPAHGAHEHVLGALSEFGSTC